LKVALARRLLFWAAFRSENSTPSVAC
jgi:hypothetical protein